MTTDVEHDLATLAQTLRASSVAIRSARGSGSGSGVVWNAGGVIVTNAHVAQSATVEVELAGGRRVRGVVEQRDERRDLASVRIAADNLSPAQVRDPRDLQVGEVVVAFGHPLGVRDVLSTGIVFARHRGQRFVQSDVKLAPGNSGGALADVQGRIVGINSMVAGGLALAIPADAVRRFMGEAIPRPKLGVRLAPAHLGDGRRAYAVLSTEAGSLADRSGILIGDVIITRDIDGLAAARRLDVLRGGCVLTISVGGTKSEEATAA